MIAYLWVLVFDLLMFARLLFVDNNARIFQRTTFLPLTNIYLRIRGIVILYELHTDMRWEIAHYQRSHLEKLVLRIYVLFEELNLRMATGIIYNHPVLQAIMSRRYPKPSTYSYNGANTTAFFPMDKFQCRKQLGLDDTRTYYLFSGSLVKWRGLENLIQIFRAHMSAEDILLIIGRRDHPYGRELSASAAGAANIQFIDQVSEERLATYINAADLCLVPVNPVLQSPGNPLKLYDYIACGKPVAGQENMPGCSDEILRWNVGVVTDFKDTERAARELEDFVRHHDATMYSMHNRTVAETHLSWRERMKSWMAFAFDDERLQRR